MRSKKIKKMRSKETKKSEMPHHIARRHIPVRDPSRLPGQIITPIKCNIFCSQLILLMFGHITHVHVYSSLKNKAMSMPILIKIISYGKF